MEHMTQTVRFTWLLLALMAAGSANAQINSVPMKGLGNDWVKRLELRGKMDWEWIETYSDRVFFMTRKGAARNGDIATLWLRVEYKFTQDASSHRSVLSRDDWDCRQRKRANVAAFLFKWNNLQDPEPERASAILPSWEVIDDGTLAQTLLEFACSVQPLQQLVDPEATE
jgi:hypothetical protein